MPKIGKRAKKSSDDDDDYAPADRVAPNPGPSTRPRRARKATLPADADNTELLDQLLAAEERLMKLQDSMGQAGPSAPPGTKAKAAPRKRSAPADSGEGNQAPKPKRAPKARKQQQQQQQGEDDEEEQAGHKELRVDKRGNTVAYRPSMSQAVKDRIDRALSVGAGAAHRLFLLDTKQVTPPGGPRGGQQEFTVLGATGNVYKVVVSCQPTCSCPDFIRGNQCKHLLFCFLRVLRCARTDPIIWQKALLPSEVSRALGGLGAGGAIDQSALATGRVRDAYAALTGKKPEVGEAEAAADAAAGAASGGKPQRPIEGDCPVCYEEMKAGGEAVCTCGTCGNHTHKLCFDRWSGSKRSMGAAVTCVWCRAPWAMPGTPAKPAGGHAGVGTSRGAFGREYVNLAGALGVEEPSLGDLYQNTASFITAHASGYGLGRAIARQRL